MSFWEAYWKITFIMAIPVILVFLIPYIRGLRFTLKLRKFEDISLVECFILPLFNLPFRLRERLEKYK